MKTIYDTSKLHRTQRNDNKIVFSAPTEYGFETNNATKPKLLADFARAVEDGIIELNDADLIAETRSYTRGDLMDKEVDPRLTTRHFDLLIAACIAYQTNSFISKPEKQEEFDYWPEREKKIINRAR